MDSEPANAKPSRRFGLSFFFWLIVLVFVIYPLSTGPVLGLAFKSGNRAVLKVGIYFSLPVLFAGDRVRPLGQVYDRYLKFCGVEFD